MFRHATSTGVSPRGEGPFPPLDGATSWLNSEPLSTDRLRGKVVLIDFWTYSCINWLRTEPYVRAWAEKYKDNGLVVVGVHSPEFGFEKDIDNVRWAVKNLRVPYPVAVNSNHAIWRAFENQYWPALYLIDANGRVRYHQFGEGEYERSERFIQQLLAEARGGDIGDRVVSIAGEGAEAAADWAALKSPETYVGYARTENFSSPGGMLADSRRVYELPHPLMTNHWALAGEWTVGPEAVASDAANCRIAFRFHARDLHLVMGPGVKATSIRFRVQIDGKPPGAAHGGDVDEAGNGIATEQRLHQLVRQAGSIGDRLFELEFFDPGVEAFSFTFG